MRESAMQSEKSTNAKNHLALKYLERDKIKIRKIRMNVVLAFKKPHRQTS
jgi:hypothetical protein